MIRNLVSLLVVGALVYGAYEINNKFFTGPTKPSSAAGAAAVSDPGLTPLVCPRDVEAFDPAAPDKTLGYFTKGTEIKVGADSGTPGMKNVVFQQPDGSVIQALCKADDLTKEEQPAIVPLEKKKQTIIEKPKGVSTWLGNNQMTIQQGCGGGSCDSGTIKLGQTRAKTIGSTFGNESPPPTSVASSPQQGVKDRAKDLQNPQTQPSQ